MKLLIEKKLIFSIITGAILSVILFHYIPDWSVLIGGLVAGTLGFIIFRKETHDS